MKYVGIVGTNAEFSYNSILLNYMKKHFYPQDEIEVVDIRNLPLFDETGKDVPDDIMDIYNKIREADGVIISSPEYDHAITSSLKSLIEWLTWNIHAFTDKPIMIVGTSLGNQATEAAQFNLRQILDAPGVDGYVLPGHAFLMPFAPDAFDEQGNIKDQATIDWLEECMQSFDSYDRLINTGGTSKDFVDEVKWDAIYGTIVIGFGGAGGTAARFAADAGSDVLLVDVAPLGHEGGNTRYAAQMVNSGEDYNKLLSYYKGLYYPNEYDEAMLEEYVKGMVEMPDYYRNYFDLEPVSAVKQMGLKTYVLPEYPEIAGGDTVDFSLVHDGLFDASLWKVIRDQVIKRSDKIDVWLEAPAIKLIQDPKSKMIVGAKIKRNGQILNIRATNGVVLSTGGFENNKQMIQDYLGATDLTPLGTLYNKGDGIKLGADVGSKMWHMSNYEALGILSGMVYKVPEGERGRLVLRSLDYMGKGSIVLVGDDGSRYFKEDEQNRHGHVYQQGEWHVLRPNVHPHIVFDAPQKEKIANSPDSIYKDWLKDVVVADTIAELAEKINADPEILKNTIDNFNHFAESGTDYQFGREKESMVPLTNNGPYYAAAVSHDVLNTQGGPQRNVNSEVLSADGGVIPNLYSAGELGGINANKYQAGGNLAECLIFGKIAGGNAGKDKGYKVTMQKPDIKFGRNDIKDAENISNIPVGPNQYIGVGDGIGGKVIVRVTDKDGVIEKVEIVEQHESGDVAGDAMREMPERIVKQNSTNVEVMSGASASSRAIKEAVSDALSKIGK